MATPLYTGPPTTDVIQPSAKDARAAFTPTRKPTASGTPQQLLGEFPTYVEAERAVDRLSDNGFPVEHARIVGTGLRSVEYVTGRLTTGRAALAGAGSGAWFGLLVGLLLGVFVTGPAWFWLFLVSPTLGALWGGSFGFLAQLATRGRRDFKSFKSFEAEQYGVSVDVAHADEAIRLWRQA